ncbi:hypothetical protein DOY81_011563, partial [Sarcophaga bullata]
NGGSLAEQAGLMPGDAVIKINDVDVYNLRHKDAQDIVVRSGNNFVITVQRGSTWRPHVNPLAICLNPTHLICNSDETSLAHNNKIPNISAVAIIMRPNLLAMALMATLRALSISNTTAQLAFIAMNLLQKHSRLRLKSWLVVSLGK